MKIKEILLVLLFLFICVIILNESYGMLGFHHGFLTMHGLALSKSLNFDWPFLMSNGYRDAGLYNRFPSSAFWLIKLTEFFNQDTVVSKLNGARFLMNLFFLGAIFFTYAALRKFGLKILSAIFGVFVGFSSKLVLLYSDMVFNDVPTLFGLSLYLWSLVNFIQGGSRRMLLGSGICCLLFSWQPAFQIFIINIVIFLYYFKEGNKKYIELFKITLIFLAFFILINSAGIISELIYSSGNSPSLQSFISRVGANKTIDGPFENILSWDNFIHTIGYGYVGMMVPSYLSYSPDTLSNVILLFIITVSISVASYLSYRKSLIHLLFFLGLAFSSFLYVIIFKRFVIFHNFQMLYFSPLIAFSFAIIFNPISRRIDFKFINYLICLLFIFLFLVGIYRAHSLKISETSSNLIDLIQIDKIIRKLDDYKGIPVENLISDKKLMQGLAPNYFFSSELILPNGSITPLRLIDRARLVGIYGASSKSLLPDEGEFNIEIDRLALRNFLFDHSRRKFNSVFEVFFYKNSLYYFIDNCDYFNDDNKFYVNIRLINNKNKLIEGVNKSSYFTFSKGKFLLFENNICLATFNLPENSEGTVETGLIDGDGKLRNYILFEGI